MQLPYPRSLFTRRVSARAAAATGSAEGRTREDALEEVAGRSPRIWMSEESESEAEEALASEEVVLASEEVVLASEEVVLASEEVVLGVVVIRLVLRRGERTLRRPSRLRDRPPRHSRARLGNRARASPCAARGAGRTRARNRTSGRRRRICDYCAVPKRTTRVWRRACRTPKRRRPDVRDDRRRDVFGRDDPPPRSTRHDRGAPPPSVASHLPRRGSRACAGPPPKGGKSRAAEE